MSDDQKVTTETTTEVEPKDVRDPAEDHKVELEPVERTHVETTVEPA